MVDLNLILYTAIGAGILALIAIVGSNADVIVSTLSTHWQASIERARAQKARREALYGWGAEPVRGDFRTGSSGGFAGSGDPVPGQQHHVEPREPGENEPGREPALRQLGKEELIVLLAVQRNDEGGYRYSANQITSFVGGAAAPIKETIATVRGKKEMPRAGAPLKRPANGW